MLAAQHGSCSDLQIFLYLKCLKGTDTVQRSTGFFMKSKDYVVSIIVLNVFIWKCHSLLYDRHWVESNAVVCC